MQSYLLLVAFFSYFFGSITIVQAGSARNNQETTQVELAQDDDESDDGGDEGYYDDGYYDDGVVWTGPGQYYGIWFDTEDGFTNWRNNYYWRGRQGHYRGGQGDFRGRGAYRGGRGGGGRR